MIQVLLSAGALIFLVLGVAHGILAFRDLSVPRAFTPANERVRRAMQTSGVVTSPRSTLWDLWRSLHFSHSLGLTLFGGSIIFIGWRHPSIFAQSPFVQAAVLGVAATYFAIAARFFFREPAIAAAASFACFLASVVLIGAA